MLAGSYQVVDVLLLVGSVAPVALYFLFLGLVNSHARPYLVSSRADFLSLTIVLVPVLIWPVPTLAASGAGWLAAFPAVIAGGAFCWMLPRAGGGFVIYNISEPRCLGLLRHAMTHLGWAGAWNENVWTSTNGEMKVTVSAFSLLRNVTVHLETPTGADRSREFADLQAALEPRLAGISQLPSTMGACLVVLGVGLMILPMWMVTRHIDDLVDAMSRLFG